MSEQCDDATRNVCMLEMKGMRSDIQKLTVKVDHLDTTIRGNGEPGLRAQTAANTKAIRHIAQGLTNTKWAVWGLMGMLLCAPIVYGIALVVKHLGKSVGL